MVPYALSRALVVIYYICSSDFPGDSVKRSHLPMQETGDAGSIPGFGGSPEVGNGKLFQYSCLENPMDRGTWWATVLVVAELDTTEHTHISHNFFFFFKKNSRKKKNVEFKDTKKSLAENEISSRVYV